MLWKGVLVEAGRAASVLTLSWWNLEELSCQWDPYSAPSWVGNRGLVLLVGIVTVTKLGGSRGLVLPMGTITITKLTGSLGAGDRHNHQAYRNLWEIDAASGVHNWKPKFGGSRGLVLRTKLLCC